MLTLPHIQPSQNLSLKHRNLTKNHRQSYENLWGWTLAFGTGVHSRSIALEANAHHARGHHTGGPKADHALTFNLDHSSGAAHGFKHTSRCHPLLPHKLSIQANTGCHSHLTNLLLISGQVHLRYPSVGLGTCPSLLLLTRLLTKKRLIGMNWARLG